MKLYADTPQRRTRQILADVLLLCWVAVCVWLGRAVHDGIAALRGPADGLTSTGNAFRDNMTGAAGQVGDLPLVGDTLRGPFDSLSGTGQQLADVGTSLGTTVTTIAHVTGIAVAAVPVVLALSLWAVFRLRFVRRASAAQRLATAPGAQELFALRALTRQPLRRLARLGPDPAGRFRDGDPAMVHALAAMELRSCGIVLGRGDSPQALTRLA
jgi:hypothetical protein